jgi:hypothetical protein
MGNFYSFLKKKINNESFNINRSFIKNSLIDNSNVINNKTNLKNDYDDENDESLEPPSYSQV